MASSSTTCTKLFCFGCGVDITHRSTDRRTITTNATAHVLAIWKSIVDDELAERQQRADLNSILAGGGKMCRKCYNAFDKFNKMKSNITSTLKKALDFIVPSSVRFSVDTTSTPNRKRQSYESDIYPHSKRLPPRFISSTSNKVSPSVEVSTPSNKFLYVSTYYFIYLQIHVGYKKPRTYVLTPTRKRLGKAVARRSKKEIVDQSMKDPLVKRYMIEKMGQILRSEVTTMCSDRTCSILSNQSVDAMKIFTWDALLIELQSHAPLLYSLLTSCTHTRRPRPNRNAVIGVCAAILLKHRYERMSLVQKIISLILYAGHSGKQVSY